VFFPSFPFRQSERPHLCCGNNATRKEPVSGNSKETKSNAGRRQRQSEAEESVVFVTLKGIVVNRHDRVQNVPTESLFPLTTSYNVP
jgi:hypothetical protein